MPERQQRLRVKFSVLCQTKIGTIAEAQATTHVPQNKLQSFLDGVDLNHTYFHRLRQWFLGFVKAQNTGASQPTNQP